ncbi:MAG: restriction endonuclease subunit S [Chloroflexota bacterium]
MSRKIFGIAKFGNLPNNWKVAKISTLLDQGVIVSHLDGNHGAEYPRSDEFVNSGVPYISANAIISGKVDFTKAKFLTSKRSDQIRKGIAKNGDVLFAHNATVGPVAILETQEPRVILGTSLTYYRCNTNELNNLYLKAFIESDLFRKQYAPIMAQSTRNQIPITTQRTFYLVLPPLPEQRKIAEILSTWDEAIAKTGQLIAALQARKQGLMQRLLTGEVRFPGFEGEWREVEIQDIAKVIMGQSPGSSAYNESRIGVPLIQGNADISNRLTTPKVFTSEITKQCDIGDIILSVRAPVGETAMSVHKACIGRGVCAIRAEMCDSHFLYHLLVFHEPRWQQYAQGSTFTAINSTDIRKFSLSIPQANEEQRRIAQIFDLCDTEIKLYQQNLAALQQQKKGLMQRLLTGEVRVRVD